MSAPDEIRVLLLKPGDLLLIGNLRQGLTPEMAQRAGGIFAELGLKIALFRDDIDIAKLEAT